MTPDSHNEQTEVQSPEKPQYFWNRISSSALRKGALVFCILLIILPIFISLTVRPWIYWLKGEMGVKFLYYHIVGQYWQASLYIIALVAMVWMLFVIVHKFQHRQPLRSNGVSKVLTYWLPINMLLLLIWSTISCLLGENREWALWGDNYCHEGLLMFYFYGTFFILSSQLTLKQMKLTAEVLVCVCMVTGVLVITEGQLIPGLFYIEDKYAIMFHNSNHYGYFTSVCVPILIGLILHDSHKSVILSTFRLLQLWLILNATMVNGTLGSFLGIIFTLICLNIFVFLNHKEKRGRMLFIDVFFVVTFLFLNSENELGEEFMLFINELFHISQNADKESFLDEMGSGRGVLWRNGIRFIFEKPLFGYGGPGNLITPYKLAGCSLSSPHNDLILISASLGLPALAFYLSGLTGHLVGLMKILKKISVFEAAVIAAVGSYLISSLTGTSMYYTTPYYFMVLGFSYRIFRLHSDRQSVQEAAVSAELSSGIDPETEKNPDSESVE